jgi:hypothetical protein
MLTLEFKRLALQQWRLTLEKRRFMLEQWRLTLEHWWRFTPRTMQTHVEK